MRAVGLVELYADVGGESGFPVSRLFIAIRFLPDYSAWQAPFRPGQSQSRASQPGGKKRLVTPGA